MRTVTFSTPQIQNAIANDFVALNSNIEGDPLAGESVGHAPHEQPGDCIRGNGRQNVQTIFLTPDQEIFHVATGFLSPGDMYQELQFALKLFAGLQREQDNRFDLVRVAHQQRLGIPVTPGGSGGGLAMPRQSIDELVRAMQQGRGSSLKAGSRNPLQPFTDLFTAQDQQYMVRHPLISRQAFESDPGDLVGRGKTFFSSSKSSDQAFNR